MTVENMAVFTFIHKMHFCPKDITVKNIAEFLKNRRILTAIIYTSKNCTLHRTMPIYQLPEDSKSINYKLTNLLHRY